MSRAEHGKFFKETTHILYDFVRSFESGYCKNISHDFFLQIIDAFLKNQRYGGIHRQNLLVSKYRIYQLNDDYQPAAEALEKALEIRERVDLLLGLAEKYYLLGQHDKAVQTVKHLDAYCKQHAFKCSLQKDNINLLNQLLSNKLMTNTQP